MAGYQDWMEVLNSENPITAQQQVRPKINTGLDAAMALGTAYLQKKGQEKRKAEYGAEMTRILESDDPIKAMESSSIPQIQAQAANQRLAMQLYEQQAKIKSKYAPQKEQKNPFGNTERAQHTYNALYGDINDPSTITSYQWLQVPEKRMNADGSVTWIQSDVPAEIRKRFSGQTQPQQGQQAPQQTGQPQQAPAVQGSGVLLPEYQAPEGFEAKGGGIYQSKVAPKLNGDQSLTIGFVDRLVFSEQEMQKLIDQGYDPTTFKVNLLQNIIGDGDSISMDMIARANLSPQQRQFISAMQNFITANLRKESGAAISASEFKKEADKYFPQYGDDAQTLEMKRRSRAQAMKSLGVGLPPGALEHYSPKSTQYIRRMGMKKIKQTATGKEFWWNPETNEMEEIVGGY